MIDVSMAQDYGIQVLRSKRKRGPVPLMSLRSSLNQAAIQEKAARRRFYPVTRSGDFPGSSMEGDIQLKAPRYTWNFDH